MRARFSSSRGVWDMGNVKVASWVLGLGFLVLPSMSAQSQTPPVAAPAPMPIEVVSEATWDAAGTHRGYVPRDFQTDGTAPAISKGRGSKLDVSSDVQTASLDSPITRTGSVSLPRMPHGYLDPTHPAGPAEAGSAAPLQMPKRKPGPYTSGFTIVQILQTTR